MIIGSSVVDASEPGYISFISLQKKSRARISVDPQDGSALRPFFSDFHLEPLRRNPDKIKLEWIHKSSTPTSTPLPFPTALFGSSALPRCFCNPFVLSPVRHYRGRARTRSSPYAITMLANLVKAAATETQVILSTQSALLLDHFQPEDVLVAELEEGATT